jgi:hypothetical protein
MHSLPSSVHSATTMSNLNGDSKNLSFDKLDEKVRDDGERTSCFRTHRPECSLCGPDVVQAEAVALTDFDDPNIDKEAAIIGILEDDSPYPEVRSAVANTDDPDIPVSTLRSWVLGKDIPVNVLRPC